LTLIGTGNHEPPEKSAFSSSTRAPQPFDKEAFTPCLSRPTADVSEKYASTAT